MRRAKVIFVVEDSKSRVVALTELGILATQERSIQPEKVLTESRNQIQARRHQQLLCALLPCHGLQLESLQVSLFYQGFPTAHLPRALQPKPFEIWHMQASSQAFQHEILEKPHN